jgi:hypothetical protein
MTANQKRLETTFAAKETGFWSNKPQTVGTDPVTCEGRSEERQRCAGSNSSKVSLSYY